MLMGPVINSMLYRQKSRTTRLHRTEKLGKLDKRLDQFDAMQERLQKLESREKKALLVLAETMIRCVHASRMCSSRTQSFPLSLMFV